MDQPPQLTSNIKLSLSQPINTKDDLIMENIPAASKQTTALSDNPSRLSQRVRRESEGNKAYREHKERTSLRLLVKKAMDVPDYSRSDAQKDLMVNNEGLIQEMFKRKKQLELQKERQMELHDPPSVLEIKLDQLAEMVKKAKHAVFYTGAGISTVAGIPDYRGPNGVWTKLSKGEDAPAMGSLQNMEPTYTHMSIAELVRLGYIQHIVSQNCDGLHLRSGLSRSHLSEIHGNSYIEVCRQCEPQREFLRSYDVTDKSSCRHHQTGRFCPHCSGPLEDTIVYFGEKGGHCVGVHNWEAVHHHSGATDLIICIGSSLRVLKHYPIWRANQSKKSRPTLVIINLQSGVIIQWTPKDSLANLKINSTCDSVLMGLVKRLGVDVPAYNPIRDPIALLDTSGEDDGKDGRDQLDIAANGLVNTRVAEGPGWLRGGQRKRKR